MLRSLSNRGAEDHCSAREQTKQQNRQKNVRGIEGKWQKQNFILFLDQLKTEKHKKTKTKSKDNFIPFIRSLAIVYREVGFGVECLIGNHNNANGDNCNQNPPHHICRCRQYNTKRDKSERKRTKVKERRKQNVVEALLVALI